MDIISQYNSNWYILFFGFFISWFLLLVIRRNGRIWKEIKEQIFLALAGLFTVILMELFAVSTNLWNYIPGNWPVILWPTYFVAFLLGYQLLKCIEGFFNKIRIDHTSSVLN